MVADSRAGNLRPAASADSVAVVSIWRIPSNRPAGSVPQLLIGPGVRGELDLQRRPAGIADDTFGLVTLPGYERGARTR